MTKPDSKQAAPAFERRAFDSPVELRAAPEGSASPGILVGYACVFNSPSRTLSDYWVGDFTEVVDPRAFGDEGELDLSVHTRVLGRTNHNSDMLLGTTDAGTLRISIDATGVLYAIDLPDTTYGRDMAVSAARGDYKFSSFAFRVLPIGGEEWEYDADDGLVRRITSARLIDVAPVADPAYWGSSTELQRTFDLDAIRASITPAPETDTAPSGDQRVAVRGRAIAMQLETERGRY